MSLNYFINKHVLSDKTQGRVNHYDLAFKKPDGSYLTFSTIKVPDQPQYAKIFACYREELGALRDIEMLSDYQFSESFVFDRGEYRQVNNFDEEMKRNKPCLILRIKGEKLNGVYRFEKMNEYYKIGKPKFRHEAAGHSWLMTKLDSNNYKKEDDYEQTPFDA